MNPIDLLSLRMRRSRSDLVDRTMPNATSDKKAEMLEVYTFAGYASGNRCQVRRQNGEIVEAVLETNGLLKVGQVVCCFRSGGSLFVRGMNKPYPEDNPKKPTIENGKIKILYLQKTTTLDLYVGGDRDKPKLIHKFPLTAKISGVCHNHGKGDKWAIGVLVDDNGKKEIKTWVKSKNQEFTSERNSDRALLLGQAQFIDPWLPKLVDGHWLFTMLNQEKTEKSLCFFNNTTVCKIKTVPIVTTITGTVLRKREGDYQVTVKSGADVVVLDKATIEGSPTVKPGDWLWDAIEYPINGNAFTDGNMTGTVAETGETRRKAIKLKLWDFVADWKNTIATNDEDSKKIEGKWREKKVAAGSIAADVKAVEVLLKRQSDRTPGFPDGSPPPPPGPNPMEPYAGWSFSFMGGYENGWNGTPFNYFNASSGGGRRFHPNDNPWWEQGGVGIGIEYKAGWLINPPQSTIQWTYLWSGDPYGSPSPENPGVRQYLGYEVHDFKVSEIPMFNVHSINNDWPLYRWNGVNPLPPRTELRPASADFYQVNYYLTTGGEVVHWWPFQNGMASLTTRIVNFDPTKPKSPAPPPAPPGPGGYPAPTWSDWSIEDYKWADPIVLGKNSELLFKSLLFVDWTGNPTRNKPEAKKDERTIKLRLGTGNAITETTIAGKLPLLSPEDTLIQRVLYRVDRSGFEPSSPTATPPKKSSFKSLPVEIYSLSGNTEVVIQNAKIFKIPDDAEILSASFFP
jgi:hypothetical protein